METSFEEKFALARDRAKAIEQFIPGTEEYYYYSCLDHEQHGRMDEVRKLLETWIERHGRTARVEEIVNRQALLNLERDPKPAFERIRRELGLTFNHQRDVEGRATQHPTRLDPSSLSRERWKETAFSWGRTDLHGFADSALGEIGSS